jgi:long-chain acyl-CoA synthetase
MSERDRALLAEPAARQVWDWLAERYEDRRLTPDTSPQLDLGIDSLAWLNLALDIRERTGIELTDEAIQGISSVRDLLRAVSQEAAAQDATPTVSLIEHPESMLSDEQQAWLKPRGLFHEVVGLVIFLIVHSFGRLLFRVEGHGMENIPDDTPYVLTPNHTSFLDAPIVASVLSYKHLRQVYWAGSNDIMFTSRLMRLISRASQTMPVAGDETGRSSLAFGALTLKRGRGMVWFPEGRLSDDGDLLPFRQGLGLLLEQYPVPVVPVYIQGTHEALPRHRSIPRLRRVTVYFGPPQNPHTLEQQGQGTRPAARMMHTLRERVAELGEQAEGAVVAQKR